MKFNDSNILHLLIQLLPDYEKTFDFIKLTLNYGVDINEPDEHNKTPLYYLLKIQPKLTNCKIFNYILDNYEVDFYNFRGNEMQEIFISQNPDLEIPKKLETSNTVFILRSMIQGPKKENFFNDFKKILIEHEEIRNSKSFEDDFSRILIKSSMKGLDEVTDLLVSQGIDVDRVPSFYKDKTTSVLHAASYGHHKVLESLLKGKPNIKDSKIIHDLLNASYQNEKDSNIDHQKCFKLLLPHCEINQPGDLGRTPLHFAVQHRNNFAILELLEKGADITKKNKFDETPLEEMGKEVFEEFLDARINKVSFKIFV